MATQSANPVYAYTVLIEKEKVYGEYSIEENKYECEDCTGDVESLDQAYEYFTGELLSLEVEGWDSTINVPSDNGEGYVHLDNNLFQISIGDRDNDLAICISMKNFDDEDHEKMAYKLLFPVARKTFSNLNKSFGWDLRVQSGSTSVRLKNSELAPVDNSIEPAPIQASQFF